MAARLNANFEEIRRTGNVYFQSGRKFLRAEKPKCRSLGGFHPQFPKNHHGNQKSYNTGFQ